MDEPITPNIGFQTPGTLMDFPDAMRQVMNGKRIRRLEWDNSDYCLLKDGYLKIFTVKEGDKLPNFHSWIVSDGDLEGKDWVILLGINEAN